MARRWPTVSAAAVHGTARKPRRWAHSSPTNWVSTIWWETSGSRPRIVTITVTRARRPMARRGPAAIARFALPAVVLIPTIQTISARRTATGSIPSNGTPLLAFGSPGRLRAEPATRRQCQQRAEATTSGDCVYCFATGRSDAGQTGTSASGRTLAVRFRRSNDCSPPFRDIPGRVSSVRFRSLTSRTEKEQATPAARHGSDAPLRTLTASVARHHIV
jgi:hypothetical protein